MSSLESSANSPKDKKENADISRRSFLRNAALFGAGVAAAVIGQEGAKLAKEELNKRIEDEVERRVNERLGQAVKPDAFFGGSDFGGSEGSDYFDYGSEDYGSNDYQDDKEDIPPAGQLRI